MNNIPEDNDLNEYLDGNSEISQLYQSTLNQEPPSSLDQMILNAAKAASKTTTQASVEPEPRIEPEKDSFLSRLFNSSWLVPTASLASFAVIAVVVAVLISNPGPNTDEDNNVAHTDKTLNIKSSQSNEKMQLVNDKNKTGKPVGPEGLQTSSGKTSTSNKTPTVPATPELWIEKIKSLHKQGKADAAKTSLSLFQKQYPNYPADKLKQSLQGTSLTL